VLSDHLYVNFDGSSLRRSPWEGPACSVTVTAGAVTLGFDTATFSDIIVTGTPGDDAVTIAAVMPKQMTFAGYDGGDSLTVAAGASATLARVSHLSALTISGTAVMATGGANVLIVGTLSISGSGRLDLRDNILLTNSAIGTFSGAAYTGVHGDVARAYDFGAWDQQG
jgi:hypothetical protein